MGRIKENIERAISYTELYYKLIYIMQDEINDCRKKMGKIERIASKIKDGEANQSEIRYLSLIKYNPAFNELADSVKDLSSLYDSINKLLTDSGSAS